MPHARSAESAKATSVGGDLRYLRSSFFLICVNLRHLRIYATGGLDFRSDISADGAPEPETRTLADFPSA